MYFTTNPEAFARDSVLRFAETTLAAYLQGQERDYAVRDVIRQLEALFGVGASIPAGLLVKAMALDPDDAARVPLVTKALDLIGREVRGDGFTDAR